MKVDRHGKLVLTEADVTKQCIDWLKAEGWIVMRQHVGLFLSWDGKRAIRAGEPGDPDWFCHREPPPQGCRRCEELDRPLPGARICFYMELKATGKKPDNDQKRRIQELEQAGCLVCVADSLEFLKDWIGWKVVY